MPLFLSEDLAKNWEHEQPWKDYPVSDNDKTYMAYYIESKKPTFAYLPETNNNYKKIWDYFFKNANIEEFIYIFLVVFQDIVSYVGFLIIVVIIIKLYTVLFYFFFYFTYIIFYSSPAYIQFIGHTGKIYFFIKQNS